MKRFVALLRGVNVRGKNKLPMSDLKQEMEALGLHEVKTYLNSGNAVFGSDECDPAAIAERIVNAIQRRFGLSVPVLVLPMEQLFDMLYQAPSWWGTEDASVYDNLIFLLPGTTVVQAMEALGAPKEGLEWVKPCENAIFWSFSRINYQKTHWWSKTASSTIKDALTIRTANTVRKMVQMK